MLAAVSATPFTVVVWATLIPTLRHVEVCSRVVVHRVVVRHKRSRVEEQKQLQHGNKDTPLSLITQEVTTVLNHTSKRNIMSTTDGDATTAHSRSIWDLVYLRLCGLEVSTDRTIHMISKQSREVLCSGVLNLCLLISISVTDTTTGTFNLSTLVVSMARTKVVCG